MAMPTARSHRPTATAVIQSVLAALPKGARTDGAGTANGRAFRHTVWRAADAPAEAPSLAEQWRVSGAGHAWSGGSSAGLVRRPCRTGCVARDAALLPRPIPARRELTAPSESDRTIDLVQSFDVASRHARLACPRRRRHASSRLPPRRRSVARAPAARRPQPVRREGLRLDLDARHRRGRRHQRRGDRLLLRRQGRPVPRRLRRADAAGLPAAAGRSRRAAPARTCCATCTAATSSRSSTASRCASA